jgi:glycolate oxidase iron-sulfur subunit
MELALLPVKWIRALRLERLLPRFFRDALELVPENASRVPLPFRSPGTAPARRGQVGFVSGCVASVLFGETNAASVRLLNRAGFDVITPPAQGCCGALYAHGGNLEQARAAARRNVEVFEQLELDAIIINAAGCGSTLKEYGHLLGDDSGWSERGAAFSRKVKDLVEWLRQFPIADCQLPIADSSGHPRVTYHDACHLAHAQRIEKAPRELVRAIAGSNFVELEESNVCCGSAGSYNLTEPEMAARLQQRKTENILKTGAKIVVTTNPGCLLQIRAGLRKAGMHDIEALHIADYLDRFVRAETDRPLGMNS